MKIDKDRKLFFGYKIDSKLREALANATPGDRRYFEDPDAGFLRILTWEQEKWIGKIIDGGLGTNDVEDIQRNVISILRRIAPDTRHTPSYVKIFAISDEPTDAIIDEPPQHSRGPYID